MHAITVCPADSFKDPAVRATKLFVDYLGAECVTIAAGDFEGVNPFPDPWRRDSFRMAELPVLKGIGSVDSNRVVATEAAEVLVERLTAHPHTVMTTGPLTNLAEALRRAPSIRGNILRLFMMGGAVRVKGNVERSGHDGSAEWNIYNNPQAAAAVIRSGIPITMVPLDATNQVPLTREFLQHLEACSHRRLARLWHDALSLAAKYIDHQEYYFWDTLTAASIVRPQIIRTEKMRISVVVDGPSQGRTMESASGDWIDVAVHADKAELERLLLEAMRGQA